MLNNPQHSYIHSWPACYTNPHGVCFCSRAFVLLQATTLRQEITQGLQHLALC